MMTRWGKDQLRNLRAFAVAVAALAFAGTALAQTKLCKPGESCRLALPTAGVYMGIQAYPYITDSENQICADQECSIQVREGPSPFGIDRKFALHLHYYGWDTLASELALDPTCTGAGSELCDDYQNGRVPVISWECDGAAPPKGSHSTDELGIDSYQRSTTDVFADNIDPFYSDFTQPAFAGKPLMVGENGSPNFAMQNEEVQDTYLAVGPNSLLADFQRKLYPRLKAYDYFDSDNFDKGKNTIEAGCWSLQPRT